MRHYAYFLAACLTLISLVCSCAMDDKADEATPRLRVSQKTLSVVKTGKLKDGTAATFQVAANKGCIESVCVIGQYADLFAFIR